MAEAVKITLDLLKRENDIVGEDRQNRFSRDSKIAREMAVDRIACGFVGLPVVERAKVFGGSYGHQESFPRSPHSGRAIQAAQSSTTTADSRYAEGGGT